MDVFCSQCGASAAYAPGATCPACGAALEAPAESGAAAPCPEHPGAPAEATCARCGRFLCAACIAGRDPARCAPCLRAARHPLEEAPFSLGGALQTGFQLFGACAADIGAVAVLVGVPLGAATDALSRTLSGAGYVFGLLGGLVDLVAVIAFYGLFDAHLHQRRLGPAEALAFGARNWPVVFVARLMAGLYILLGFLLLIIPGLMNLVTYSLVVPAALFGEGLGAADASKELTLGRRWPLAGLLLLSGLLVGIGNAVVTWPLRMALIGLEQRLPIGLAHAALLHTLTLAGEALSAAFVYAAYLGLRAASRQVEA